MWGRRLLSEEVKGVKVKPKKKKKKLARFLYAFNIIELVWH